MIYIWFDTETSGINPKIHSVLTAYFAVYNEDLEFVDELELFLKPDNSVVVADEQALKINNINLEDHLKNPRTLTYSEGKEKIIEFFEKHKPKGRSRLRPSGHNIEFDKGFILNQLMEEEEWSKFIHHSSIDTYRIFTFLQDIEMVPSDVSKLGDLVDYFNIPKRDAHDAREDVKMNIELYKKIKSMFIEMKNKTSLSSGSDLLKIIEL